MPRSEVEARPAAWSAAYASGTAAHEGTPWLAQRREAARRAFDALPMPTWRRGRGWSLAPEPLDLERYRPLAEGDGADESRARGAGKDEDAATATFVDGRLVSLAGSWPKAVETIVLGPGGPEILPSAAADWLGALVAADAGKLEALNLAAFTGGLIVRVAAGARPPGVVRLRHRVRRAGALSLPRVVVVLEAGAEASVVEECVVADDVGGEATAAAPGALVVGVSEIVVGEGAHLRYADVTALGPADKGIWRRRTRIGRDAHVQWTSGVFGGGFLSLAWDSELVGPGARLDATGVYLSGGREQHALVSDTWHRAPSTEADVQFRGAVFDRSGSVFDGIIRTEKTAKGTLSHLGDHLLFLSPHARADSIPALLIEGDDVKVGHGATIGRVDPEQVFYLGTRGIEPEEARQMLVLGYFEPTLARIPDEALRERQRAAIERRVRSAVAAAAASESAGATHAGDAREEGR